MSYFLYFLCVFLILFMCISNESILVLCLIKQQTQLFILFDNFIQPMRILIFHPMRFFIFQPMTFTQILDPCGTCKRGSVFILYIITMAKLHVFVRPMGPITEFDGATKMLSPCRNRNMFDNWQW